MLFCIGDIHGHFDKLIRLMNLCRGFAEQRGAKHPRFVLLGDYVDRGPDSRKVIEYLETRPTDVLALCGNHEDLMLRARGDDTALILWLRNGGMATLESYGVGDVHAVPESAFAFIEQLPIFHDDGLRLFVHAGIDIAKPEARAREVLLWTRHHPPPELPLGRFLVHGHTPIKGKLPELHANRLNLDTGAGFGRTLSAAAFDDVSEFPIAFLNHLGEVGTVKPMHPSFTP
jgi:serine/threonine protein phosphatase 1